MTSGTTSNDFFSSRNEPTPEDYEICGSTPDTPWDEIHRRYLKIAPAYHQLANEGNTAPFQRLERAHSRIRESEHRKSEQRSSKVNEATASSRPGSSTHSSRSDDRRAPDDRDQRPSPYRHPRPMSRWTRPPEGRHSRSLRDAWDWLLDTCIPAIWLPLVWVAFFAGPWLVIWIVLYGAHGPYVAIANPPVWKLPIIMICGFWLIANAIVALWAIALGIYIVVEEIFDL